VKERPIIMRAESVRAILAGTKSQTRRIVKPQPREIDEFMPGTWAVPTDRPGSFKEIRQHYTPGDRLWVREAWAARLDQDHLAPRDLPRGTVGYWADGPGQCCRTGCAGAAGKVRSPIHMPRWASRLTLEVTDVRVERLQQISEEDAIAEGARRFAEIPVGSVLSRDNRWSMEAIPNTDHGLSSARWAFANYWNRIHRPDSWDASPWVWVIEFRRVESAAASEVRA
jgi:hypothetical protein